MPWNSDRKQQSKEKILRSAATLFVENGFDEVGINDVMKHAAMTRGAFYAHFDSKVDLYNQAIAVAAQEAKHNITAGCEGDFTKIKSNYLNQGIDENLKGAQQCPIALLISDIKHRDEQVRESYQSVFLGFVSHLEQCGLSKETALKQASTMIGAVALSKSLNDPELIASLLKACDQD